MGRMLIWLKKIYANTPLLKKLTAAYTLTILIPAVFIGLYSYHQTQHSIRDEFIKSSMAVVAQIRDNITWKVMNAESMSANIAYNPRISSFLQRGFHQSPDDVVRYKHNISPIVDQIRHFNQVSIYQVGIYYKNATIPELWGNFFREDRIRHLDWYTSFQKAKEDSMWLSPRRLNAIRMHDMDDSSMVFSYLMKIKTIKDQHLGVIILHILVDELFLPVHTNDGLSGTVLFTDSDFELLYGNEQVDILYETDLLRREIPRQPLHFQDKEFLYVYQVVPQLDVYIINKVPLKNLTQSIRRAVGSNLLVITVGSIILIILTHCILTIILKKMKQIVHTMNHVARGNFNTRIPVEGTDESGQLAEDFNILIEKINALFKLLLKKETAQKDAQILALQYQINPHFIYNTIDIFRMKMELSGEFQTAGAMADFGKIMRYNVSDDTKFTTIREEIRYVQKYINLQKLKYGERLTFTANIPNGWEELRIIKFILQPVVENSIKHGLTRKDQNMHISIDLVMTNDLLRIMVIDDGSGIEEEKLAFINQELKGELGEGSVISDDLSIGLSNINSRLRLFYGEPYHIVIESEPDVYTKTNISIPIGK